MKKTKRRKKTEGARRRGRRWIERQKTWRKNKEREDKRKREVEYERWETKRRENMEEVQTQERGWTEKQKWRRNKRRKYKRRRNDVKSGR